MMRDIGRAHHAYAPAHAASLVNHAKALQAFNRAYWLKLLKECGGCITEASRRSGRNRTAIYRILNRLGIEHQRYAKRKYAAD